MKILPSVDSTSFRFPPQVVAALAEQLPPPGTAVTVQTDPDGTPVLVIGV